MEVFTYVMVFLLGMVSGIGAFIAYANYQFKKMAKAKVALLNQLKEQQEAKAAKAKVDAKNTIKERLIKAANITHAQMDLRAQAEMPSKNALHSKYKNGLVAEINDLEQQKIDLLKTVLAEGFDPLITVIHDDGSKDEVKLSQYVNVSQEGLNSALGSPPPPPNPDQPRKAGKFFILKGGKDDGTSH